MLVVDAGCLFEVVAATPAASAIRRALAGGCSEDVGIVGIAEPDLGDMDNLVAGLPQHPRHPGREFSSSRSFIPPR